MTSLTLWSRPHHHQTKGQHANTEGWRYDGARPTFGLGQKPQVRKVRFRRMALKKSKVEPGQKSREVWPSRPLRRSLALIRRSVAAFVQNDVLLTSSGAKRIDDLQDYDQANSVSRSPRRTYRSSLVRILAVTTFYNQLSGIAAFALATTARAFLCLSYAT